jgi:predicted ATPase/DNA-binding winged helix-turn-helix (wHTH) protein
VEERGGDVPAEPLVYESGSWQIDLGRRELRSRGVVVPIGGRAFDVIEVLVRSAGVLVTKDDLMGRVWGGTIVEENTLQVHMSAVRRAFGADRGLLKTAAGRGYRLLGAWKARADIPATQTAAAEVAPQLARAATRNVPAATSDLIGRAVAVQELKDLLSAYRVVTLTGPGGIGKTALVLEVARRLFPGFPGEAWLVELASLSDPALVPSAVARSLGLKLEAEDVSAVAKAIGTSRRGLIILDNCEHVIDAAASLVETVLRLCSGTSVLATSREVLRIEGEHVYRVPPLDVPPEGSAEADVILDHAAVQLFIARVGALNDSFASPGDNLRAIAAICRRLDGIPLAIELAAARAATLGPPQVAALLNDRFVLLTGGRRTALPRHQTLRATLDWSYDLLPEMEAAVLRRLGVFAGDFSLDAAIRVSGDHPDAPVVDQIANLVTKSLVVPDLRSEPAHYRLLDTTRLYALEKLRSAGEHTDAARRHAEHYLEFFIGVEAASASMRQLEWLAIRSRHIDNVRAALDWAFSPSGDSAIGVDLTAAYASAWIQLSLSAECRERCEKALANLAPKGNPNTPSRMKLWLAHGSALLNTLGPADQAQSSLAKALDVANALGDAVAQVRALVSLQSVHAFRGEYTEAREASEQLHRIALQSGDVASVVRADRLMGITLLMNGRPQEARQYLERVARSSSRREDHRQSTFFRTDDQALARASLALALCLQGCLEQAYDEAQASLEALQSTDRTSFCRALTYGMCRIAFMTGDLATADRAIPQLIAAATSSNLPFWMAVGQLLEGRRLVAHHQFAKGQAVLREAFDICGKAGWRMSYPESRGALAEALAGLGQFDDAVIAVDEAVASAGRGRTWCLPELLRIKGVILLQQGSDGCVTAAEDCLARAADIAREQGALLWELRIALSVARLWTSQNRPDKARRLLAPVYARFTEGFASPELKAACAMLDALRA